MNGAAGAIAGMHPAYFAMVMATGVVSIACDLLVIHSLARAMFAANVLFAAALVVLTGIRIARFREHVVADLQHHGRAVGFFTTVAAAAMLGSQTLIVGGLWTVAAGLWAVAILLWAVLTYTIFTALTIKPQKPTLEGGINGGWLVSVVAPQSIAVLGTQLAPGFGAREPDVLLFCLVMWLGAGMLYIWIISLIFYRYTFFPMSPADLAPPYWINMGAVAISTLAGSLLALAATSSPLLTELRPFVKGLTLLFWATATWWIPMLLILGVWRYVYRRFPLQYDPLYWGAVFPLGMYTVCTLRLSEAIDVPGLVAVSRVAVWIALAAWATAFAGLIQALVGAFRRVQPGVTSV